MLVEEQTKLHSVLGFRSRARAALGRAKKARETGGCAAEATTMGNNGNDSDYPRRFINCSSYARLSACKSDSHCECARELWKLQFSVFAAELGHSVHKLLFYMRTVFHLCALHGDLLFISHASYNWKHSVLCISYNWKRCIIFLGSLLFHQIIIADVCRPLYSANVLAMIIV